LYVAFLPLWWAALPVVTSIAAACADFLYHFFNSAVSIAADSRVARVTLEAGPAVGDQPVESGLRMETISYGMPMLAALIAATRPVGLLHKLEALGAGLAIMAILSIIAVVGWARLVSLQAYDQMMFVTTSIRGHTSAFTYYCFHGYAFSQPVVAVIIWMSTSMSGIFEGHRRPVPSAQRLDPKSPCHCGSGRQYRRCCGKSAPMHPA